MTACRVGAADIAAPVRLENGWQRTRLPDALGRCVLDAVPLGAGLSLNMAHYAPVRDLVEISALERAHPALTITIALQGRSSTEAGGQRFDFIAGHGTLAVFASIRGERRFAAHTSTRQLRLVVEGPMLHQYGLGPLLSGTGTGPGQWAGARQLASGPYTAATRHLADTLVHLHQHAGGLLELQIAALGLLAEQTRAFRATPGRQGSGPRALRAHQQEKILRARDLLLAHFDQPLTLAWLCAAVGTNECALKSGFRACFGTSVQRMLGGIRMQKARELLAAGWRASSVAYKVGYRHPASFSTAFARHFGQTPKEAAREAVREAGGHTPAAAPPGTPGYTPR